MPASVGICFAHASLQVLAEDHGINLLHIKGPAVDESLLQVGPSLESDLLQPSPVSVPRASLDADVLVRPSHLPQLFDVLHRHGWSTTYRFEDGSAFEHAATMAHPFLAPVDVHRRFPGIGLEAEAAFDRLWADRHLAEVGGYPCPVPSVTAQRLILILHAARGASADHPDIRRCWLEATEEVQADVDHLAKDLSAEVGLAAGTGRLDRHKDARDHDLWRALSTGEPSMVKIWAARVRAAPSRREALRTAVRLAAPNIHRLEADYGRPPTRRQLASAYVQRAKWGLRELARAVRGALMRRRP